jgi:hypothetical protein
MRDGNPSFGDSFHIVFDVAEYGGHEVVTLGIAAALARRHTVRVTAPAYNRALVEALGRMLAAGVELRIELLGRPRGKRLAYIARLAWRLLSDSREHTATIIPQGWPTGAIGAVLAAWATRTPHLVSYLPMWVPATGSWPARALKAHALRACRAVFARVVTISEPIAQNLAKEYRGQEIAILPNRVSPPSLAPMSPTEARRQLGLPAGRSVVAIIGRIDFKQKGQLRLMDAVRRCADLRDFVFAFVGTGPDEADLARRIDADGTGKQFLILPWRSDIVHLLHAFDAVAMPSLFEGVPLVMLETLLVDVPFVGSREVANCVPGLEACLFCDFDDPAAIGHAITAAVSRSVARLSPATWCVLMDRFCPDDQTYLARCEASFSDVTQ